MPWNKHVMEQAFNFDEADFNHVFFTIYIFLKSCTVFFLIKNKYFIYKKEKIVNTEQFIYRGNFKKFSFKTGENRWFHQKS